MNGFGKRALCGVLSAAVAASMTLPVGVAYAASSAVSGNHSQATASGHGYSLMGGVDDEGDEVLVSGTDGMERLAQNVASGNTYAGVTVKLIGDLDFEDYGDWTPIGSKEHPFCGTFTGSDKSGSSEQVRTISGLSVKGSSYLGLFGYVGAGGCIKNIKLTDSKIEATSATDVIRNVGSIAGYVYGVVGEGSAAIQNCSSNAVVSVTSTMKPESGKDVNNIAPDGDIPSGSSFSCRTFAYIGGLAGYCAGSISSCSYSGSLDVTTHEAPVDSDNASMGTAVGGIVGQVGGYVTSEVVTDNDEVSLKPHYPIESGGDTTMPGTASTVSDCVNNGAITVTVDGESGQDRFGEATKATMSGTGGIAGYAMANFSDCQNHGEIFASNESGAGGADGVGGIVGNLRSVIYSGFSSAVSDAGTYKAKGADESTRLSGPTLTVNKCTNDAKIVGLHAPGGIVGGAGTYTVVDQCANLKGGNIYGVRWNKPMVGGIIGQTFGTVSYCYNRANTNSGLKGTGGGYYVAGIAGCTTMYEVDANESETFDSPTSLIYACYSTGAVYTGGSFKQGGICGDNEGYIHDCYFLYDKVSHASELGDDKVGVAENYGTVDSTTVIGIQDDEKTGVEATDLIKSKEYVAKFNNVAVIEDYTAGRYFVPASSDDQNDGNAVLAWQRTDAGTTISESGLSASGAGKAVYSAVTNPLPVLEVKYNGKELVEGADYYAVPDADVLGADGKCQDISVIGSKTFKAAIIGIGDYSTGGKATNWTTSYSVGKANFSTCTVTIKTKTFNYLAQYPAQPTDADNSEVKIMDASGTRVPVSSYTMAADPGTCINYHQSTAAETKENDGHSYTGYRIKFTANADSNYTGDVYGIFTIAKAQLIDSDNAAIKSITWNGQSWKFRWGSVVGGGKTETGPYRVVKGKEVSGMTVTYCGQSIMPQVNGYTFKDGNGTAHELKLDEDYRVVYGDPGDATSLISNDSMNPNVNVGSKTSEAGSRPCFTLRYVAGSTHNFLNYQNVFFTIARASIKNDCKVSIPSTIKNGAKSNIKVKSYTGKTLPDSDYTVSAKKAAKGKLKVTLTGVGNLKGSVTKTVKSTLKPNTLALGAASKKVKAGDSFSIAAKKAKGNVTYSTSNAQLTVSKGGKVTVSSAAKSGSTYTVVVTAAGTSKYLKGSKTVTVKVS